MESVQDIRAALIAAAEAETVAVGGAPAIGATAARAGVPEGCAFRLFQTPAALTAAVAANFFDRYDQALARTPDEVRDWFPRERARLERVVAHLAADPLAPLLLGPMADTAEVAAAERAGRTRHAARAADWIADGQARGEVEPGLDTRLAGTVWAATQRDGCAAWLAANGQPEAETFVARLWPLCAAGLVPRGDRLSEWARG